MSDETETTQPVVETPAEVAEVVEDRRAPDQDAAVEQAFEAGALPEEDRRSEPQADGAQESETASDGAPPEAPKASPTLEERVPPGSIIERTATGWTARIAYGGAIRLHGDGATIDGALTAAGV